MARSTTALVLAAVVAAALAASALALGAAHHKPKAGPYSGATSEQGTVVLKVTAGGKRVTGFTTSDGYNDMCKFSGGVGGMGNYTVKMPAMKVTKSGSFTGTAKASIGPFSGNFRVEGKFTTATTARGTVTKVGSTCGSDASNPTTPDYLETFTASRS